MATVPSWSKSRTRMVSFLRLWVPSMRETGRQTEAVMTTVEVHLVSWQAHISQTYIHLVVHRAAKFKPAFYQHKKQFSWWNACSVEIPARRTKHGKHKKLFLCQNTAGPNAVLHIPYDLTSECDTYHSINCFRCESSTTAPLALDSAQHKTPQSGSVH